MVRGELLAEEGEGEGSCSYGRTIREPEEREGSHLEAQLGEGGGGREEGREIGRLVSKVSERARG